MMVLAYSAAQSAAAAAWATFVVLVLTALFAGWQLLQNRQLRREEVRPYVIVQYEFRSSILVQIVIKNLGRTIARDINVTFDKPLTSAAFEKRDYTELALLQQGIPSLAPGQVIRINLDSFPQRVERGLPLRYTATVRYHDHRGKVLPTEVFPLDLAAFADTARAPHGLHELVEELERVRREVEKWTADGRGLKVKAVDLDRYNRRSNRPFRLGRALQRRKDDGWRGVGAQLVQDFRRAHGLYADD